MIFKWWKARRAKKAEAKRLAAMETLSYLEAVAQERMAYQADHMLRAIYTADDCRFPESRPTSRKMDPLAPIRVNSLDHIKHGQSDSSGIITAAERRRRESYFTDAPSSGSSSDSP